MCQSNSAHLSEERLKEIQGLLQITTLPIEDYPPFDAVSVNEHNKRMLNRAVPELMAEIELLKMEQQVLKDSIQRLFNVAFPQEGKIVDDYQRAQREREFLIPNAKPASILSEQCAQEQTLTDRRIGLYDKASPKR